MPNKKEINKKIQKMILSNYPSDEIIRYVKGECQTVQLTPMTLGMLFEIYAGIEGNENDPSSFFSKEIGIDELKNIHPGFESTNGCQWARSDGSYLGKKYKIKRPKQNGKVAAIQLDGPNNDSIKKFRNIRADIKEKLTTRKCAILDISSNLEVDHKDGKYNLLSNINSITQKESDFQILSKAANDAKRQHCKECIKTGKRYDAKRLGYKESYIVGDENTSSCLGCYWYDPQKFNKLISQNFEKTK